MGKIFSRHPCRNPSRGKRKKVRQDKSKESEKHGNNGKSEPICRSLAEFCSTKKNNSNHPAALQEIESVAYVSFFFS